MEPVKQGFNGGRGLRFTFLAHYKHCMSDDQQMAYLILTLKFESH